MAFSPAVSRAQPSINQPPLAQTIFYGDPVTFTVSASGTAPLSYQWFRNGISIPGATSTAYTIAATSGADDNASFAARVSNLSGAVTSAPAVLTIDFGIPGAPVTQHVLDFTNVWRFNQSNNFDGIGWFATNYNDASWQTGAGLLAAENNANITPLIRTTLRAPNAPPPGLSNSHAYYFRTTARLTNDFIQSGLQFTFRADDGAVIYTNGAEAARIRMNPGTITNLSLTTGFPPDPTGGTDATTDETLLLQGASLVLGTNTIAVSVHQANNNSSDIVFGMALDVQGYQRLRDTQPPTAVTLIPGNGSTVVTLNQIEVHFSEAVKGVDADDLRINGVAATNVTVFAPDVYVFKFPEPPTGQVQVAWSPAHGIIDLSANSNSFGGGAYAYTLDPGAFVSDFVITEFMAGNSSTIRDEDGAYSDWIEIHNTGAADASLDGWYLTDNPARLNKWRFPAGVTLPAQSYKLVWASSKDRTNAAAPLHTNFKLDKAPGNYLALVLPDGVTVASSFTYPQQYDDVSYGRDRSVATITGYFTNATPGNHNSLTIGAGFGTGVKFSKSSGAYQQQPFALTLSSDTPGTIRYFLVTDTTSAALTDVPNINSPAYTAPLNISNNVQVRARVFPSQTNLFPGPISSETYIRITAGAAAFSSASPIALFHNFTGGTPPATVDQPAVMMVWDNKYGRASMTNPPDAVARIGLNLRGHTSYGFAVEVWDEFNDDRDMEVLGLPEESDWIFYRPNAFDQVLIHNPVAQAVSSELGRYASRSRMVEVFTSFGAGFVTYSGPTVGNYDGVYVLEEKVKANDNRVNVPRLAPEETNAPAITGGYIFKKDKSDPEGDEVSLSLSGDSFIWVEPRMRDLALYPGRTVQRNYLINYVNQFTAALNGPNWTNPVTGYAAWIDVDAWIDHHIINSLTLCSDALRISAYLYKDRGGKLALGPIWDFDRSQGTYGGGDTRAFNPRAWRGRGFDNGTDFFGYNVGYSNPWMNRLFNDPDFWQRWIDRWQQLRREELSNTNLFRIVDQLGNSVREAQPRMAQRQTETAPRSGLLSANGYSHMFSGTYQGELDFLKRWYSDRVDFVDTNLLNPPVFSSAGGPFSNNYMLTITSGTIEPNSTIYYTLNGTDPRRPGGSINPSAFAAANSTVVTLNGNARVFARNYNAAHSNLTGPSENPPISSRWSGPTIGTFYASVPALRITEIMFNPLSPPPGNTNDADNFEFIEFKNVSGSFLNLQNFRLHGGVDFTFTNVNLAAGQHVVLVKNVAAFQSRYGTGAVIAGVYTNNLGNGGDHIALDGPLAEPILDFEYKDSWYPATDGLGFSLVIRDANAATGTWSLKQSWRPSGAANGLPGVADPPPPSIFGVLIAEALTHTDLPNVDMVELFNPTPASANIGGWLLTDDPHEPVKYRIPPGTEIPAGGYLTIASNQFSAGPLGFALSSLGDEIYLFSTDASTNLTGYGHGFSYGAAPNPVSFGRYVNSSSNEHFVLQSLNTLGTNNAYPRVGPVVISEIMYHPPDYAFAEDNALDEFIELQNITATNVPLYDPNAVSNTWRLRNAVDFDFPTNVVLPPDGRLLVVNFDPQIYGFARSAFVSKYAVPTNVPIFGPWDGKLDNGGETIELKRPDNPNATPTNTTVPYYLVEEISYDDSTPWPTNADGGGTSLQRIDSSLYGNDSMNWQAAASTAGQPNPSGPAPDVDRDGLPDAWELTYGLDPSDSTGDNGAGGDPDFDGANNLQEYMNGTNPKAGVEVLRFDRISLSNQMAVLEFNTVSGRTYAVEAVTNLSATNAWLMVTNGIPGNGGPIMVQDPVGPDGRFYRLRSSP